jgi:cytochrome P450
MIFPNIWSIHHQEEHWNDPYTFKPDRWVESGNSMKDSPNFIPFSTGPRKCPGRYLANAEAKLVIASIFQRFTFGGRDGDSAVKVEITELPGLTVKPAPYWVVPKRRL